MEWQFVSNIYLFLRMELFQSAILVNKDKRMGIINEVLNVSGFDFDCIVGNLSFLLFDV